MSYSSSVRFVNTEPGYALVRRHKRERFPSRNGQKNSSALETEQLHCNSQTLMAQGDTLDARERPPAFIKNVYKFYQKLSKDALASDAGILDLSLGLSPGNCNIVKKVDNLSRPTVYAACYHLHGGIGLASNLSEADAEVYEAKDIPGKPSETLKFQYDSLKPNRFASDPIFDPWRDSKGSFVKAAS